MKQKRTLVILILVIVLLLVGGTFAYRMLSRLTEPTVPYTPSVQSDSTDQAQEAAPAPDFTVRLTFSTSAFRDETVSEVSSSS